MTFNTHDEVRSAATQAFAAIPHDRFSREIEKLKTHLNSVIVAEGDYIV
jgi:hypothetical protein